MSLAGKPLVRLRHQSKLFSAAARNNTTMATSSTHSAAPWRKQFLEHMDKMEPPEFVLGTVAKTQNPPLNAEPRVRFCVFRGMWASLPPNKRNEAPRNSESYESDCFTFTTDVRMDKAKDFFESSDSDYRGSGGGAPVEAVWWVKDDIQTQWRVRGDVWMLAPDFEDGRKKGPKAVKEAISSRMRAKDGKDVADFDWTKEVTAHFGNLSPGMRGKRIQPASRRPC
jgi:pyridoxamine 5'-phosphate oxidase